MTGSDVEVVGIFRLVLGDMVGDIDGADDEGESVGVVEGEEIVGTDVGAYDGVVLGVGVGNLVL